MEKETPCCNAHKGHRLLYVEPVFAVVKASGETVKVHQGNPKKRPHRWTDSQKTDKSYDADELIFE